MFLRRKMKITVFSVACTELKKLNSRRETYLIAHIKCIQMVTLIGAHCGPVKTYVLSKNHKSGHKDHYCTHFGMQKEVGTFYMTWPIESGQDLKRENFVNNFSQKSFSISFAIGVAIWWAIFFDKFSLCCFSMDYYLIHECVTGTSYLIADNTAKPKKNQRPHKYAANDFKLHTTA